MWRRSPWGSLMIATSKSRNITIKVSTTYGGRPTSGWTTRGDFFWRMVMVFEGLYADASKTIPVERLAPKPDDWEIKP